MLEVKQITVIGSGIIGEATIAGLLAQNAIGAGQIVASDPLVDRRHQLEKSYGVQTTENNLEALQDAEIVMLCVKPQVLGTLFETLKGKISPHALVVSVVAGATLHSLRQGLGHESIVRAMPNTPAQVGQGMTVWTASPAVSEAQQALTRTLLQALGTEMAVSSEQEVDWATALSGAGPSFVFLCIEAAIDAGIQMGLSRSQAQTLTQQTIAGSVELMRQTHEHPTLLRNQVTSPGGVTAAGLYELEKGGLRTILCDAIHAAFKRNQDLSQQVQNQLSTIAD